MRVSLLTVCMFLSLVSRSQETIGEINDSNIYKRVVFIKSKTDSFLRKITNENVFKLLVADFGVTYMAGEFYKNYRFLNDVEKDPDRIYDLTQFYFIYDEKLHLADTIGVFFLELKNRFAPEYYILEVRFVSNADYLKIKALNYLYKASTQLKLNRLIDQKKIKSPHVKISVEGKSNTYFILLGDKNSEHKFAL